MNIKTSKQWDKLSNVFNTHLEKGKVNTDVADNVEILWPLLLKIIGKPRKGMLDVLDYGCGCGGFCKVLNSKGFKTTGIDLSSKMIHTAIKNSPKEVEYLIGDLNLLKDIKGKFNAILATMVMQFIENPESYILALNKILSINGIFVMSVFNPVFVKECIKLNKAFVNENKINIGSVLLNTYTRTAKDYKSMLVNNGFKFLSSYYPKFNKAFVQKYKWALPSDISEYLVMVFKKEI